MTRLRFTGDVRANASRARVAGHRPTVPQRRRACPSRPPHAAEPLESRQLLSTFTVTTAADEGPGSLRQAILDTNALAGPDEVRFDIPGEGLLTIAVQSPLPDVTDPLTLDATTQPGYSGVPRIDLDGVTLPSGSADGLVLRAAATVRGLGVTFFPGRGVVFAAGSAGGRLEGSYVGVIPSGTDSAGRGNRRGGVVVSAPDITLGASDASARNVISNNLGPGVWVTGATGTVIQNSYIGTSANGTRALGNAQEGVLVEASSGVRIGSGARGPLTVVSGNSASGIRLAASATDVTVANTYVGTNVAGDAAVPNGRVATRTYRDGITTEATAVKIGLPGLRTVISANPGSGVAVLGGTGVVIRSSYIGTDATGARSLGTTQTTRQTNGVRIAGGGGHAIAGDSFTPTVISGNAGSGVLIERTDGTARAVWIYGSAIGTNAAGTAAVPNGGDGIAVSASGPGSVFIGYADPNVISGNAGAGIRLNGTLSTTVSRSFVGTNDPRRVITQVTTAIPNSEGVVVAQGSHTLQDNWISGNSGSGVAVSGGAAVTMTGNRIGTDFGGTLAVPNGGHGVEVFDAVASIGSYSRNIISGNRGDGILVAGTRARAFIRENYIGTTAYGSRPLGNGGSGVYAAGAEAQVEQNVISANGGDGITVTDFFGYLSVFGGNVINDNAIGTNAARSLVTPDMGNAGHGIAIINSAGSRIGRYNSSRPTEPSNLIAFNGGSGVFIQRTGPATIRGAGESNVLSFNGMFANGGLGIDLGGDGVTPNDPLDADSGPNRLQNFPVIQEPVTARGATTSTTVRFTLESEPNQPYTVQLYSSPAADPSGYGEGALPLNMGTVQVQTDASGHAEGSATVRLIAGTWLTATATGRGGTSEFSAAVPVSGGPAVVARHVFYNNTPSTAATSPPMQPTTRRSRPTSGR
jgi:hypothetical protein